MDDGALQAADVEFEFNPGHRVLGPVSLEIPAGSRVALVGPSGSGKSTLLQLLAGVLAPTRGTVDLDGQPFGSLSQDRRARTRLERFGMVFQFAELVPELTLAENVELPLRILGQRVGDRADRALDALGVAHRARELPSRVSGGERQRAAIARAMIHDPRVILADEPTGSLDQDNGRHVLDELVGASERSGVTLVVVTHDREVAAHLDRVVELRDGRVVA